MITEKLEKQLLALDAFPAASCRQMADVIRSIATGKWASIYNSPYRISISRAANAPEFKVEVAVDDIGCSSVASAWIKISQSGDLEISGVTGWARNYGYDFRYDFSFENWIVNAFDSETCRPFVLDVVHWAKKNDFELSFGMRSYLERRGCSGERIYSGAPYTSSFDLGLGSGIIINGRETNG